MKKALVVGGSSGIGLSTVLNLLQHDIEKVYIVDRTPPDTTAIPEKLCGAFQEKTCFYKLNLITEDYYLFDEIQDINILVITAGFGRVAPFNDLTETEVINIIKCNELSAITIIKKYYEKIFSQEDFYTCVMGSIAGHIASPLFSVYGASKSGLCSFIENINIELSCNGIKNRILDVSPGSIKGTKFSDEKNDIELISEFTNSLISKMFSRETLYIPQYDEIYRSVILRYQEDPLKFGKESYLYKINGNRVSTKPQTVVGYLSGTFDLFHIGHLNLLKRAKAECDYLIVGVHKSGAWKGKETFIPFEERVAILSAVKYVDRVVESLTEDSDAYDVYGYNKLFVGSDYKGTARFLKYEEYFKDKDVEIIYFPYTKGTSSTKLREALSSKERKES